MYILIDKYLPEDKTCYTLVKQDFIYLIDKENKKI